MTMPDMRDQRWGLELEFTGITRYEAAKVLSAYFDNPLRNDGGYYDKFSVEDGEGRKWTLMSDGSIKCQRKENHQIISATSSYSVELVTPICRYEDIETLQKLVRALRGAGAFVNDSCGIHVHVDGAGHTPKSIRNMINIVASKNDLLYQALQIGDERRYYCKKLDEKLIDQMNRYKPDRMDHIEDIWYGCMPGRNSDRTGHYHDSRYHFLNLHSFFNGNGTLEFRGFNSTLHTGKVKTAVQLSLAMCHQAKIQKSASRIVTQTDNPKYTFRTYLLRLGLIGDEFKTARQHLLEPLPGNISWRDPAQAERQRERLRQARELEQTQALAPPEQEPQAIEQTHEPAMEPDFSF